MTRALGYEGVKAIREKLRNISDEIEPLRSKDLLSVELDEIRDKIIGLFDEIRGTEFRNEKGKRRKVGPTAASEVLHLACPDLFVMWDSPIRDKIYNKHRGDGKDYFEFLGMMKTLWMERRDTIENLWRKYGRRPTRIIDQYNWEKTHPLKSDCAI